MVGVFLHLPINPIYHKFKHSTSLPFFRFPLSSFPLVEAFSYTHVPAFNQTSPYLLSFLIMSIYSFKDLYFLHYLYFPWFCIISPSLFPPSSHSTLCRIYQPLLSFSAAHWTLLHTSIIVSLLECVKCWFVYQGPLWDWVLL